MFVHLLLAKWFFFIPVAMIFSLRLSQSILRPPSVLSVALWSRDKQQSLGRPLREKANKFVLPCCFDIKYCHPDVTTNALRVKNVFLHFFLLLLRARLGNGETKAQLRQKKAAFSETKGFCHKLSSSWSTKNCLTYILTWVGCFCANPAAFSKSIFRVDNKTKKKAKKGRKAWDGILTPYTIYHNFMIQFEIFTNYSKCICTRESHARLPFTPSHLLPFSSITFHCWMSTSSM